MELFWGLIKIDQSFISSYPLFIITVLIIAVVSLFILTLGKHASKLLISAKKVYLSVPRVGRKNDWIANCKERRGWLQKGDALALELNGKYLRELSFMVEPVGKPTNWRGGFIMGNPTFSPTIIIDNQNAITCHSGAPPVLDEAVPVWLFDEEHDRNNNYSTLVKAEKGEVTRFFISINDDNFLRIEVNGQLVYAKRIDSSLRKKAYLLAWGDEVDCKVNFAGITYYYV